MATRAERIARKRSSNAAYWRKRELHQRELLYDKTVKDLDIELAKQYTRVGRIIRKEILSFLKELETENGGVIQPSDLYKSGRYYEMLNHINDELTRLGFAQIDDIESGLMDIYEKQSAATAKEFGLYTRIDRTAARNVINEHWCSDGAGFSDRIWKNKDALVNRLEEHLMDFVSRGQPASNWGGLTTELISDQLGIDIKNLTNTLDTDFAEAYHNARRLVRTETARVQNRSTQDRYKEAGFTKYQVVAEPDCCEVCEELTHEVFDIDNLVLPAHPNCRCAMEAITESMI